MRTRNAMHFRVTQHSSEPEVEIVEVWIEDEFIATITPGDEAHGAIRVASKYLRDARAITLAPVPYAYVEFVGVP